MKLKEKYFKKSVLVLGMGKTGKSIIRYLKKFKANIYIWDDNRTKKNIKLNYVNIFNPLKNKIADFEAIFVSPGINKKNLLVKKALKKNITIASDIELFWCDNLQSNPNSNVIAITGTNGKSTIASMISNSLKTKPLGNFGNPILDYMKNKEKNYIIELSSFQLDYIDKFKPKISIISNINVDHLNYHETFESYLKAKLNIFKNQTKDDYLILNFDDKNIKNLLKKEKDIKADIIKVSCNSYLKKGITIKENYIHDNYFTKKRFALAKNRLLNLKHNQLNFGISFITLLILGMKPVEIIKSLGKFKGLAHRLEFIGSISKIEFYNDSKATNVSATCSAISAFKKVILIAGGSDKGDNFETLKDYSNKIVETYLIGKTAYKISKSLQNVCKNNICNTLQEAVEKSYEKSIATGKFYPIIFSPACASFDNYNSFEERGEHFKKVFNEFKRRAA